jgi:hypothetical protein
MCKLRSVLSGVLCCDISDHLPNFAIFDSLCNYAKPNAEPERFLVKIDYKKMQTHLGCDMWKFITPDSDLNDDYNNFLSVIRNALEASKKQSKC